MSFLNDDSAQSEWLKQAKASTSRGTLYDHLGNVDKSEFNEYDFKVYPIKMDHCSNPLMITTNDGNRHQLCSNCGWRFNADEE